MVLVTFSTVFRVCAMQLKSLCVFFFAVLVSESFGKRAAQLLSALALSLGAVGLDVVRVLGVVLVLPLYAVSNLAQALCCVLNVSGIFLLGLLRVG
eukprot:810887-Rhodomonas_salina.2